MKLAIITDVHADVHALQDALVQIERLGCDEIVCAGDVVDYGLFPQETIDLLREKGVPTIRGNHDRRAVHEGRDASGWDLNTEATAWLASLPPSRTRMIEGVRVAVHHARPGNDLHGIYPDDLTDELASQLLEKAKADVLIVGHTHLRFALSVGGGLICNPGALLRDPAEPMTGAMLFDRSSGTFVPAPAAGAGTFGVLELPALRFTVHVARDGAELQTLR